MIRFLLGVNLLLLAAILGLWLLSSVVTYQDAARSWREARANGFERDRCELKHATLLKKIEREGLWKRLGMRGQPWLQ